ncbi:MAG: rhodanese-like domain-containing protein [Nitrospirota bacterium]
MGIKVNGNILLGNIEGGKEMRKLRLILLAVLGMAIFLCSASPYGFAEDGDNGIGEYVSGAAPKGGGAVIPPGHYGVIASYADAFLSNAPGPHRTIFAETLVDGTDDPATADELYDFFLLDIRKAGDFCKGHISEAVNIPFEEVARPENLAKLPTDMPILVICYTGHTASQINSILNMLGYNAWTLRFGMTSWRAVSSTAVYSSAVKQDIYGGSYSMVTSPCP